MRARLALLALASTLAACAGESEGALSQATFGAGCAAGGACVAGLDAPLAVGARLPLRIDLQIPGTATPPMTLRSVSPEVFSVEEDTAVGIAPGVAALLLEMPDGPVLDFVHLWVAAPEGLALVRRSAEGGALGELSPVLQLLPGDEVAVSVEAVAGGQELLGDFDASVAGAGPVVAVLGAGVPRWFRLRALAAGETTLRFDALGHAVEVRVEVLP